MSYEEGDYSSSDSECITCVCFGKVRDSREIFCDGPCQKWYHSVCMRLKIREHDEIMRRGESIVWVCQRCLNGQTRYTFRDPFKEAEQLMAPPTRDDRDDVQEISESSASQDSVQVVSVKPGRPSIMDRFCQPELLEFHDYIMR